MDCLAFFTVAVLFCTRCLFVPVEGKHVDSTVKLASNMTLECAYPKTASISQMSWSKEKNGSQERIAVFRVPYELFIENGYKTTVHIHNDTINNKSLAFNNASKEDAGFYLCIFHTYPLGRWEKRIEVVQSDDSKGHVFLDPHVIADSQVTKPNKNVTLMCLHDADNPLNQVLWERKEVDRVDFIGKCPESSPPVYGSDYEEHVQIDCANPAYSTLVIWNASARDTGIYHCSYFGANGKNESSWTKLTIASNVPLISVQHIFFFAGASAILLIITLASVVVFVHHKRKKKKNKRINMMKIFYKQPHERSGCQHKANANRRQKMAKSEEIQDETYENITCFSE